MKIKWTCEICKDMAGPCELSIEVEAEDEITEDPEYCQFNPGNYCQWKKEKP